MSITNPSTQDEKLLIEFELSTKYLLSQYLPGIEPPERVSRNSATLGDLFVKMYDGGWAAIFIKDVIHNVIWCEAALLKGHLLEEDRKLLSTYLDEYIISNIDLINVVSKIPNVNDREVIFSRLFTIKEARWEMGLIMGISESSLNLIRKNITKPARESQKAVDRRAHDAKLRARAKEELRKMWGAGISNSYKAASIVQPKLQQRIGVAIDPEGFPKPSTIRKLIGELAAEQVH